MKDFGVNHNMGEVLKVKNKGVFAKSLAILGLILVWIPVLLTIVIAVAGTIASHALRFDYLMPAELFPFAFIGALLLLWASLGARSKRILIICGFAALVVFPVIGSVIAQMSGLASGETEPGGFFRKLVVAALILYILALVELCIASILLVRGLFDHPRPDDKPDVPQTDDVTQATNPTAPQTDKSVESHEVDQSGDQTEAT